MENCNWKVYAHISPNGKIYVGMTGKSLKDRFKNGKGYKKTSLLRKAIDEYGWNSFLHIVLFEGLTKEEAEEKEIECIRFYSSNNEEYGYNRAIGGCVNKGYNLTEEHKEKLKNAKRGMYFGADNPSAKEIVCLTTGEIFATAQDASVTMGCCRENIVSCCRGRLKSAGKHPATNQKLVWKYSADAERK